MSSVGVGEYHAGIRFALDPGTLQCYWSERDRQTIVSVANLGGTRWNGMGYVGREGLVVEASTFDGILVAGPVLCP